MGNKHLPDQYFPFAALSGEMENFTVIKGVLDS